MIIHCKHAKLILTRPWIQFVTIYLRLDEVCFPPSPSLLLSLSPLLSFLHLCNARKYTVSALYRVYMTVWTLIHIEYRISNYNCKLGFLFFGLLPGQNIYIHVYILYVYSIYIYIMNLHIVEESLILVL